ncbi:hypothetical protein KAM369_40400 [Aeromonas caviae]|nr:hypothetical protein KAM369_40400 [Aeromonas caviae]GJB66022.1 hypothetical protein KAM375_40760 [Aeromonas caviae]
MQYCSELTPSITRPQGQAADNRRRPTHQVIATAQPHIEAPPCSGPWGTWPSPSSAPRIRSRTARPADTRRIGAVTGWWGPLGRLQLCSEFTPSITRPQGQTAGSRRPDPHTR